jgi:hypothetical protein
LCHGHENNQDQIYLTKTRTRPILVPNLDCETKEIRKRTWHMQNKNLTRFYYKEEETKNISKIGVEHIRSNGEFYLYLYLLSI